MGTFSTAKALAALAERRDDSAVEDLAAATAVGRSRLNPDDLHYRKARAAELEKDLLQQFLYIQEEPPSNLRSMRLRSMLDRLGELAAEQGHYEHAALISHDEKRRRHYRHVRDAIRADDAKTCQCEDERILDHRTKTEFTSPAMLTVDTILDSDGRVRQLDLCRKCGFMNAR